MSASPPGPNLVTVASLQLLPPTCCTTTGVLEALSCVLASKTLSPAPGHSLRAGGGRLSPGQLLNPEGARKPRSQGLCGRAGLGRGDCGEEASDVLSDEPDTATHPVWCWNCWPPLVPRHFLGGPYFHCSVPASLVVKYLELHPWREVLFTSSLQMREGRPPWRGWETGPGSHRKK